MNSLQRLLRLTWQRFVLRFRVFRLWNGAQHELLDLEPTVLNGEPPTFYVNNSVLVRVVLADAEDAVAFFQTVKRVLGELAPRIRDKVRRIRLAVKTWVVDTQELRKGYWRWRKPRLAQSNLWVFYQPARKLAAVLVYHAAFCREFVLSCHVVCPLILDKHIVTRTARAGKAV